MNLKVKAIATAALVLGLSGAHAGVLGNVISGEMNVSAGADIINVNLGINSISSAGTSFDSFYGHFLITDTTIQLSEGAGEFDFGPGTNVIFVNQTASFGAYTFGYSNSPLFTDDRVKVSGNTLTIDLDGVTLAGNPTAVLNLSPLAAVPEPETYAMLLAGLGLMGSIARRRKAVEPANS